MARAPVVYDRCMIQKKMRYCDNWPGSSCDSGLSSGDHGRTQIPVLTAIPRSCIAIAIEPVALRAKISTFLEQHICATARHHDIRMSGPPRAGATG